MNYFLISDTHFNHTKLDEWGCRSGDWQEQLYAGIANLPIGAFLIHLGDICIGKDEEVSNRIAHHATSILVRGNHDCKSARWYYERGWDVVLDALELNFMGEKIRMTHFPEPKNHNVTLQLHGHTHGNNHREIPAGYDSTCTYDLSPELVGYKPISLKHLIEKHHAKLHASAQSH